MNPCIGQKAEWQNRENRENRENRVIVYLPWNLTFRSGITIPISGYLKIINARTEKEIDSREVLLDLPEMEY